MSKVREGTWKMRDARDVARHTQFLYVTLVSLDIPLPMDNEVLLTD